MVWGGLPGDRRFLAVGGYGGGIFTDYFGMYSTDGVIWQPRDIPGGNWQSVAWGDPAGQEKYVAVSSSGTGERVMTSPDGITWTSQTSAADNEWRSVTWGGPAGQEKFVAVSSSGTGDRVMTSPDGVTWTIRNSAADNDWRSVAWGGAAGQEKYVAVASTGTGDRVMVSG